MRTRRSLHLRFLRAFIALAALVVVALPTSGCAAKHAYSTGEGAKYAGLWWTGNGSFLVAQLTSTDGRGVVLVWDKNVGKTLEPRTGYRVVAVEQAAPRVWLVPDEPIASPSADRSAPDLAGDAQDAPPRKLLLWDLSTPNKPPTDEAEARWRPWPGNGGFTAYPEIDVLKGSLIAKLLFQPSSGETEGSKAAIPSGVNTLQPVGWSASGDRFAAFGLTGSVPVLLVFSPRTGQVEASATVAPPSGGGVSPDRTVSASWGVRRDDGLLWMRPPLMWLDAPAGTPEVFAPASSYAPAEDSVVLGVVPEGALVWQRDGSDRGIWVLGDPAAGEVTSEVTRGAFAAAAYDEHGGLARLEADPLRVIVTGVGKRDETVWEAE